MDIRKLIRNELELPSIRTMFIPDTGYIIIDADLQRADAQVVAQEAGDWDLLKRFRSGEDVHTVNAQEIFQTEKITKHQRYQAKQGVHLTNYGGSAWALAYALKITKIEAEYFQTYWFKAHPKILEWHLRIEDQLARTREVQNAWGYKRFYFDRIEGILKEALAWIPQSTVAITINKALVQINDKLPEVELLLQVHDSLVMQIRKDRYKEMLPKIKELMKVKIPYDPPLEIAVTIKESPLSWGHCQ